jgi:hypothetical protein
VIATLTSRSLAANAVGVLTERVVVAQAAKLPNRIAMQSFIGSLGLDQSASFAT